MRIASLAAGVLLLFATAAPADDAADAKAIVAKAIKASGAKDEGKSFNMTWKDVGKVEVGGMKIDYTADWWFRAPDAMRFEMVAEVMGMKIKLTHIVNGDKVYDGIDGKVEDVAAEKKDYSKGTVHQLWVTSLAPLTHDKEFKLSTVVGKMVNDKPTHGVLVERKDCLVITLYFDKASGLLVKSEANVKDEFQGWKEVLDEAYYEDYKDIGGRQVFSKIRLVRDGKAFVESVMSDMKEPETLDAKLFEKPQ